MGNPVRIRFDLTDLRLFIDVADTGSITAGAARAHIAVASASVRIRNMEDDLGAALFVRGRQGVALTPAGSTLLRHARIVIRQLEHLAGDLGELRSGAKGHIRLMCNTAALAELVSESVRAFLAGHPGISIDLQERASPDIVRAVGEGATDIGVVSDSIDAAGLETFALGSVRLMLIVAANHPLASRQGVSFTEALDHDFVGMREGGAMEDLLARMAARAGKRISYRARLTDYEAICRMIESGVGVGVLPARIAERYRPGISIRAVEIADGWTLRRLTICVRRLADLPSHARQLVDLMRS